MLISSFTMSIYMSVLTAFQWYCISDDSTMCVDFCVHRITKVVTITSPPCRGLIALLPPLPLHYHFAAASTALRASELALITSFFCSPDCSCHHHIHRAARFPCACSAPTYLHCASQSVRCVSSFFLWLVCGQFTAFSCGVTGPPPTLHGALACTCKFCTKCEIATQCDSDRLKALK
jgi:hypothetical protein